MKFFQNFALVFFCTCLTEIAFATDDKPSAPAASDKPAEAPADDKFSSTKPDEPAKASAEDKASGSKPDAPDKPPADAPPPAEDKPSGSKPDAPDKPPADAPPTKPGTAQAGSCTEQFIPNFDDCGKFFQCAHGTKYAFDCGAPTETCFDTVLHVCVWRNQANQCACKKA